MTPGNIFKKDVLQFRSFVGEPMQYGRLFLAVGAAHTVPPTGAKGLNLAMADVHVLDRALGAYYDAKETGLLESYSQTALQRVWRAQHFSWWMTSMLHRFSDATDFDLRRQLAELEMVVNSPSAAKRRPRRHARRCGAGRRALLASTFAVPPAGVAPECPTTRTARGDQRAAAVRIGRGDWIVAARDWGGSGSVSASFGSWCDGGAVESG